YEDFTQWHLKELVRLRFLPEDFPTTFLASFVNLSGKDLLEINKNSSEIEKELSTINLALENFESWKGRDMIFDFYRLKHADELAAPEIGLNRLKQYEIVCKQLEKSSDEKMVLWAKIFLKTMNSQP